jgi:hypothetical protein
VGKVSQNRTDKHLPTEPNSRQRLTGTDHGQLTTNTGPRQVFSWFGRAGTCRAASQTVRSGQDLTVTRLGNLGQSSEASAICPDPTLKKLIIPPAAQNQTSRAPASK